jgi:3-oxoacyl-(acyl-carrier-protein) synthase
MAGRRVVVTGLGVVNAAGQGVDAFWRSVRTGVCRLSGIRRFDAAGFPVQVVGEVAGFDAARKVPRRFLAKTDRFTHLAFAAVDEALADAGVDLEREDRTHFGVWFGNNTGGWDLCERGFSEYYLQGADVVNPWQATAWFLAAPQGFLTIRHGLRGMSKSFSGDRSSGAVALYYGVRAVQWGRNDVVLAGGCEAPVSPLSLLCFDASGDLSRERDPARAYRPFDRRATGLVVGEGGVALVLEEAGRARRRGAPVHGEVLGAAHGTSPSGDPRAYARVMARALDASGCGPGDIDLLLCEGCGSPRGDRFESEAVAEVFGREGRSMPVTAPKSGYGHLFGAGFGTDVLAGLLAARDGVAPPTPGFESAADHLPAGLEVLRDPRPLAVRRFMVTSHSRYGTCVAMVLGISPLDPAGGSGEVGRLPHKGGC